MKHFKKVSPRVPLQLSNGAAIRFENVDGDWGIYKTANPALIAELEAAIRNEVGGVAEITEEEYNALAQKKTMSRPYWREELGKGAKVRPSAAPRSNAGPAVDADGNLPRIAQPSEPPKPVNEKPVPQSSYRPTAIPRKS